MLVRIFGGADVLLGVLLIFLKEINLPVAILLIVGIILLIKSSLGLFQDFASWIDALAGLTYLLSTIIYLPIIIYIILGLLLIQKGVFSFL